MLKEILEKLKKLQELSTVETQFRDKNHEQQKEFLELEINQELNEIEKKLLSGEVSIDPSKIPEEFKNQRIIYLEKALKHLEENQKLNQSFHQIHFEIDKLVAITSNKENAQEHFQEYLKLLKNFKTFLNENKLTLSEEENLMGFKKIQPPIALLQYLFDNLNNALGLLYTEADELSSFIEEISDPEEFVESMLEKE